MHVDVDNICLLFQYNLKTELYMVSAFTLSTMNLRDLTRILFISEGVMYSVILKM